MTISTGVTAEELAEQAVPRAARLVAAVHDDGPDEVARHLTGLTAPQARALVVVLAAMVDPTRSPGELLAWTETWTPPRDVWRPAEREVVSLQQARAEEAAHTAEELREAHREFKRCRRAGRPVPDDVARLNRIYKRISARKSYHRSREQQQADAA